MSNETPYQVGPQVDALQAERANCVAYGNDKRIAVIDRQLAEFGVKQEAAEKRASAASSADAAKSEPPKNRRGKESTQVRAGSAEGSGEA